ncbi:MAG: histidine phosphatase family protein [Roseovarius sp.]
MTRSLPELWVLRHGQTEWNAEGRMQGRLDSPLTALGLAQARAQNAILRRELSGRTGAVTCLASPSGRAWRTAEIAIRGLDLTIAPDPDLQEIDMGAWQGCRLTEIRAALPDAAAADPHLWKFDAPGGERLVDMVARVERLLGRLSGPTVLVTHGVTSRVLRSLALGRPVREMAALPGGQGVVHHLRDGIARLIAG